MCSWVDGHDGFVDAALADIMSGLFVRTDVGAGAAALMIVLGVGTSLTGMPLGHIVSTGEAVVGVVVVLVVVERTRGACNCWWWDAVGVGSRWCWRCHWLDIGVASASSAAALVAIVVDVS